MKYTHLEMVQRILESMDSDEVNSYADTVESAAVSNIIRETFFYLSPRLDLPIQQTFFQLTASGDNNKPVLMTMPSDQIDFEYLKYREANSDGDTTYKEVAFVDLETFYDRTFSLEESRTEVETMTVSLDGTNFTFKFRNDANPTEYTVVDNYNVIFNSYDTTVDGTLQSSKTLCYGTQEQTYTLSDTFTPNLDHDQFQVLLNEAKQQAHSELKQTNNQQAGVRARKSFITAQRTKRNMPKNLPEVKRTRNYGRNTR